MSSTERPIRAGTVGRAHGLDGAFYVNHPSEPLAVGGAVRVRGVDTVVERLAGTAARPIVSLRGVDTREGADALRGEVLYVEQTEAELGEGEYFAAELVGMRVADLGTVRRVVTGPSCDVLEVGDEPLLIPFIRDAVRRVDSAAGTIEVDLDFLGLR